MCLCSRRGAQREMARYLSVLTPSIPFCPLFHRPSVSLYRSCHPRPSLLLLPCLHSISKSIRSAAKPLFPLFRKLSDALSRTTYMSTPSSPTEDFDSCLIHVSHTVTWVRAHGFPRVFPTRGRRLSDISIYPYKKGYQLIFKTKTFQHILIGSYRCDGEILRDVHGISISDVA